MNADYFLITPVSGSLHNYRCIIFKSWRRLNNICLAYGNP
jgi:hypothetical protein